MFATRTLDFFLTRPFVIASVIHPSTVPRGICARSGQKPLAKPYKPSEGLSEPSEGLSKASAGISVHGSMNSPVSGFKRAVNRALNPFW